MTCDVVGTGLSGGVFRIEALALMSASASLAPLEMDAKSECGGGIYSWTYFLDRLS